jgi:hypothetical protein
MSVLKVGSGGPWWVFEEKELPVGLSTGAGGRYSALTVGSRMGFLFRLWAL